MKALSDLKILLRGGGEMASAVAHALWSSHMRRICITEIARPTAIRRAVCFSEAVYDDEKTVEGVRAELAQCPGQIKIYWEDGIIPVLVDPEARIKGDIEPDVLIEATLMKQPGELGIADAPLVIALGPGFHAGVHAHAVIETNRGHNLGRILQAGETEPNTGMPGDIGGVTEKRVLRAPADGVFVAERALCDPVSAGDRIGSVSGARVYTETAGVLRGLIHPGIPVTAGMKIGDVDPRGDVAYCDTISDKARAIAGAVLQTILMRFNR